MRTNTIIGGIIFVILLSSIVYIFIAPFVYRPIIFIDGEGTKVTREYSLNATQVPGVENVNLNFTIKAGGLDVAFTNDSNLVYWFIFEQDEGEAAPSLTNITVGNELFVNVTSDSGNVKATFGNYYNYSGTLEVGAGGISAVLSEVAHIDSLDLVATYVGGIFIEILNNASFDHLNTTVNTGGIILRIQAETLGKNSTLSSIVEVGGVLVESLPNEPTLGIELNALIDLGGISVNRDNFSIFKETDTECEMRSTDYLTAPKKLDINIFTGAGGILINQPFFQTFPVGYD